MAKNLFDGEESMGVDIARGETTTTEETTDAVQVDHPAAQALLVAQADYQTKAKGLLEGYFKAVDEIRDNNKVDLPFPEILDEQQKAQIIADHKAETAEKLHHRTVTQYERAVDEFAQQAQKHTAKLRGDLFGVGAGGSAALNQAVSADEEQLVKMIEFGELTGDPTLAKAAFAAGVVRGDAPQAVRRYLDSNLEAEPLLRVYQEAPRPDWFETTRANIARMIRPPTEDQLRSRPQIRAY